MIMPPGTARIEITVAADAALGGVDADQLAKVTIAVGAFATGVAAAGNRPVFLSVS